MPPLAHLTGIGRSGGSEATSKRGQVLVLFAVGAFVLIGAIGLGIDSSRTFEERRAAQTAVDHAATAAAYASCEGGNEVAARAAGRTAATRNGFNDAAATIVVTIDPVVSQPNTYRAAITSTISGSFARILGINDFTVSVEATAGGEGCGGGASGTIPGAVFAGGATCPGGSLPNIKISGNDHKFIGGTHTNGKVAMSGNTSVFTNTPPAPSLTYGGPTLTYFSDAGSGNNYTPIHAPSTLLSWPAGYAPADQTASMWDAYKAVDVNPDGLTDSTFDNVNIDGVWYTEYTGTVDVKQIADGWTGIIVSRYGPITFGDALIGRTFNAPATWPAGTPPHVMIVSGFSHVQPCDQFAIVRSGEGGTWNGIWWAPNAQIRIEGPRTTVNGSLITFALQMAGNEHAITANPAFFPPAADPIIVIYE